MEKYQLTTCIFVKKYYHFLIASYILPIFLPYFPVIFGFLSTIMEKSIHNFHKNKWEKSTYHSSSKLQLSMIVRYCS